MINIAPSLLSADFANLQHELENITAAGADWLHIDVMDGHFVPNLTFGPLIVEAIRPHSTLKFDVHLMIEQPERYIDAFVAAGADSITVHHEACIHLHRTIRYIKEAGVEVGVAINPSTPVDMLEPILHDLDLILIMTINPGFGGQTFIPSTLKKVKRLKEMLIQEKLEDKIWVQVDGGINEETAPSVVEAGANVLVAGTAVFGQEDRGDAIRRLKQGVK